MNERKTHATNDEKGLCHLKISWLMAKYQRNSSLYQISFCSNSLSSNNQSMTGESTCCYCKKTKETVNYLRNG